MALLHPASFASTVASSKDSLKRVSDIIGKYCGNARAGDFLTACEKLDFSTANHILDETVKRLTGYEGSVSLALGTFADKFRQVPGLSNQVSEALSETAKVKAIESHRDEIIKIIKDN